MDLEKNVHISELYDLNHRNDKELHQGFNYKDSILVKNVSSNILKNDKTYGFLLNIQEMMAHTLSSNVIIRNWFVNSVSKYYDRHNN